MLLLRRLLVFLTMIIPCIGYSQSTLEQQLEGKTTFREIMKVVDRYFAEHQEALLPGDGEYESDELHWRRWEWYMSGRLGPHGEFVNIPDKLMQGLAEKERMHTPQEDRNINSNWTFMGPLSSPIQNPDALFNGLARVDEITFHPTNANNFFICTPAGGLWGTLNDGVSWYSLTDYLPSIGLSGFVISWADPTVMYLLTGEGNSGNHPLGYGRQSIGILKSTDGGVSWQATGTLPNTSDPYYGYALEQSPTNPEILIAATSTGLYRTTNGGMSWTQEGGGRWWDIKFKPIDGTRVYATKDHELYISTDSGDNWTVNTNFDTPMQVCDIFGGDRTLIAVSPSTPTKVFVLAAPRLTDGYFCGAWVSFNDGISFTRGAVTPNIYGSADSGLDDGDQTNYDMAFTVRIDNSSTIFAGGLTIWKSINDGTSWTKVTSYNEDGAFPYIHPDVHYLAYNPLNSALYAATDGGVYKSTTHGASWTNLFNGIGCSQFYHMAGWDGNINKLMGGLQDNGVKYRISNSTAFSHISCCDGFDVAFNPVTGRPFYSSVNYSILKYGGDGTSESACQPTSSYFFKTLAVHNTDTNIVMVGTGDGIYRSIMGAAAGSWVLEGGLGSWSLASCPSNSARFYAAGGANYTAGGNRGLYFSSNTGDTWTLKSTNAGFPDTSTWTRINDIAVRPNNSSTVYACFGGFTPGVKVVMSTNTGDSWTNISLNLPNVPVNALAIDNDNGIYAGTDIGVFYKSATMTAWMPWSNQLPNVPVTELVIFDDGVTRRIRAATFGRGVWQSNLAATCDAAVVVTGNLEGVQHYEASSSITSTAFIQGGIGTFVSFKSGNYITLSDGFNVVDESEFLGFISPCGVGGIPSAQDPFEINRADPNSSIILLRRMWNPETELPYGSIDNIEKENDGASITFSINKPGEVQVYAAKAVQEKLISLYSGKLENLKHTIHADLSALSDDFHYLLLFYEGKLAHFQELDLRN